MTLSRRFFLSGLGSMLAAPAIVHAGNLMPVRPAVLVWGDTDLVHFHYADYYLNYVLPKLYRCLRQSNRGRIMRPVDLHRPLTPLA